MKFEEYIKLTRKTAVYPEEDAQSYLYVGMMSELNEVCDKLSKSDYTVVGNSFTERQYTSILNEIGDVCWFAARMYDEFEVLDVGHIIEIREHPVPSMKLAAKEFKKALNKLVDGSGVMSKYLRKDEGKEKELIDLISNIYYHVRIASMHLGIDKSMSKVFQCNIDKLFDRKDRGVLRGDGDDR